MGIFGTFWLLYYVISLSSFEVNIVSLVTAWGIVDNAVI